MKKKKVRLEFRRKETKRMQKWWLFLVYIKLLKKKEKERLEDRDEERLDSCRA